MLLITYCEGVLPGWERILFPSWGTKCGINFRLLNCLRLVMSLMPFREQWLLICVISLVSFSLFVHHSAGAVVPFERLWFNTSGNLSVNLRWLQRGECGDDRVTSTSFKISRHSRSWILRFCHFACLLPLFLPWEGHFVSTHVSCQRVLTSPAAAEWAGKQVLVLWSHENRGQDAIFLAAYSRVEELHLFRTHGFL